MSADRVSPAPEPFHIVICGARILLVRAPDTDWRALQARFADFTTSLGPCDLETVFDLIDAEWPALLRREADIRAFAVDGAGEVLELTDQQ